MKGTTRLETVDEAGTIEEEQGIPSYKEKDGYCSHNAEPIAIFLSSSILLGTCDLFSYLLI